MSFTLGVAANDFQDTCDNRSLCVGQAASLISRLLYLADRKWTSRLWRLSVQPCSPPRQPAQGLLRPRERNPQRILRKRRPMPPHLRGGGRTRADRGDQRGGGFAAHRGGRPEGAEPANPGQRRCRFLKSILGFSTIRKGGSNRDRILCGMAGSRLNIHVDGGVIAGGFPSRMESVDVLQGEEPLRWDGCGGAGARARAGEGELQVQADVEPREPNGQGVARGRRRLRYRRSPHRFVFPSGLR